MKHRNTTYFILALIFSIISVYGYNQTLQDSLIVKYGFNGSFDDISGNGIDAIEFGAILTEDRFGNLNSAVLFDGIDDYLGLPNIEELKPDLPVTISFWVYAQDLDLFKAKFLGTESDFNNYSGFWIHGSSDGTGKISANFGDNSGGAGFVNRRTKTSDLSIELNTWHNITCVFKSALDIDIYIDCHNAFGDYSGSGSNEVAYSGVAGKIGSRPGNSNNPFDTFFQGKLDDFAFWNRALSQDEIVPFCENKTVGLIKPINLSNQSVNIYPNPLVDIVRFKVIESYPISSISISNVFGQVVHTQSINQNSFEINLKEFPNGVYFFRIFNIQKSRFIEGKLVKTNS